MRKSLLIVGLALCSAVGAEEWGASPIAVTEDATIQLWFDPTSLEVAGPMRHASLKWVFKPYSPAAQWKGRSMRYRVTRDAVDCADGSARSGSATIYFEDGSVDNVDFSIPDPLAAPIPAKLIEAEVAAVCGQRP